MNIFKLYFFALRKVFVLKGRAPRIEYCVFHILGLFPVFFGLIFSFSTIQSIREERKQFLAHMAENTNHTSPSLAIDLEIFQENGNLELNSRIVKIFRQKIAKITTIFCQHLPSMIFLMLSLLAYIIPSFSVTIRRLHDIGLSGLFSLIQLIPLIGIAIFLILMLKKGNKGSNGYGPDPCDF